MIPQRSVWQLFAHLEGKVGPGVSAQRGGPPQARALTGAPKRRPQKATPGPAVVPGRGSAWFGCLRRVT
jgi:hypothetical protein